MEHEDFPTQGFEFMNEPATEEQKDIIVELARARLGREIDRHGEWPSPFSRWDAARMIETIEASARGQGSTGLRGGG
jgi:hypothetical protein